MKRLIVGSLVAIIAALTGVVSLAFTDINTVAHADESETSEYSDEAATNNENSGVVMYEYVAQPGDSYSLMARKAAQTYGIIHGVEVSEAAILYAETNLTKEAGSPILAVGQHVSFDESLVSEWMAKASKLSDQQLAEWNYYVQFANFNTDHVGESRS